MAYTGPKYHRQNGRYYKVAIIRGEKNILDSDDKRGLERDYPGIMHDHFYTKNGQWYVQTKIENKHIFEEIAPGIRGVEQADSSEYLDALFDELQSLPDC
ncbi:MULTISPECIES: hypothetical protein [unclassified Microcoleus]|uniref:hypothetical protein n=1 Tax=unclassified Microcoleus TaxID=2642155 RepID=UPI001D8B4049|nr:MULTISPECIES: hypothetical protein [unclassified Microcoleus]MCC3440243.1 hypothetical protein [Microcoleus sp. PH2017_03_ELD_O_A]MCC3501511.1 hypothetical protein [Microcoleus sp. PH2017_19_SFW_U_A]TAF91714.1 MAG: hypothetical protein EAZ49_04120 [Oscillatoriales cyanobacterium]MCC3446369.1 hypothetical protein [Microcoleus sp. PH2017_09_SFU_O_A]MCC3520595.1 hypothetical protein [Microcoleus sp. PH2017_20_SFW_D_A]